MGVSEDSLGDSRIHRILHAQKPTRTDYGEKYKKTRNYGETDIETRKSW
jgi:hypothetical protein